MIDDDNDTAVGNGITTIYGSGRVSIASMSAPAITIPYPAPTMQTTFTTGSMHSGMVLQTAFTTGSPSWSQPGYSFNGNPLKNHTGTVIQGDAEFEGDIKIKGKSLTDTLDRIEQRLGILHPDEELEEIWTELKELGDRYRELIKNIPEEITEKKSMWDILKK